MLKKHKKEIPFLSKSNTPLFWRYMLLLCIVAILFSCALIITTRLSRDTLENNFLEQTSSLFEQNSIQFQENIQDITSLTKSIEDSYYFIKLKNAEAPLSVTQELYLSYVSRQLFEQASLTQQFSDVFIYFTAFESGVDKYKVFRGTDEFAELYSLSDSSYLSTLCSSAKKPNVLYFYPAEFYNIPSLSNMQSCILILSRGNRSDYIYGFFLSTEKINSIFKLSSLPEGSFITIEDINEEFLLYNSSKNEDFTRKGYHSFTYEVAGYKLLVTLSIPNSYFSDMARSSQRMLMIFIPIALLIGIFLCLVLSYIGVMPAQRLLLEFNINKDNSKVNELDLISDYLSSVSNTNAQMRELLMQNALIRLFSGGALTEDECKDLDSNYAEFSSPLILAIIHNQNDAPIILLKSHFQNLDSAALCIQATPSSLCLIIKSSDSVSEILREAIEGINSSAPEHIRLICGLSLPFEGAKNMETAMNQAQTALPPHNAQLIRSFEQLDASSVTNLQPHFFKLKVFQQELDYWHKKEVTDIINNYLLYANFAEEKPKEIFYTIYTLLNSAAASSGIELSPRENTGYSYGMTPQENMVLLLEIIEELFAKHEALVKKQDKNFVDQLMAFIDENISNPAFSIVDLVSYYSLPENIINEYVRNVTGKNFSKYFMELRMERAADLLRNSEYSVNEISEMCGCPASSTFYRNFKKYSSMTPVDYRNYYSGLKS